LLNVNVNTTLLKTKFQLEISEDEAARSILAEVAKKLKDNIYMNSK